MSYPQIQDYSALLRNLLKDLRHDKNFTQVELAALLEQSQSFVSKYENGERILDILEIRFICVRLGISFLDFCRRLEELIVQQEARSL